MKAWQRMFWAIVILAAASLWGCSSGGDGESKGGLSVSLTDSATDDYQAVYVTISRVEVHRANAPDGEWIVVAEPNKTLNLLDLINGVTSPLGITQIPVGSYTQMRLIIGETPESATHTFANYVVDTRGIVHALTIPSGLRTGIKLVHEFTVTTQSTTELILDFDALVSIVTAGSSGQWLLKPTITVYNLATVAAATGKVTDAATGAPLPGAKITAQSADSAGNIVTHGATIADDTGAYQIFLAPGTYVLVAAKDGYDPGSATVTVQAETGATQDFALTPSPEDEGTAEGVVVVTDGDSEASVRISIRKTAADGVTIIEIAVIHVTNGGTFDVDLPEGQYELVAWIFDGSITNVFINNLIIVANTVIIIDPIFNWDEGDDADGAKVALCHKGHTITVAEPAVSAHLQHGDTLGPCGSADSDGDDDDGDDGDDGDNGDDGGDVDDDDNGNSDDDDDANTSDDDGDSDTDDRKVTLCHNGHTISVAQSAVDAHLAQGDTLGPCPDVTETPEEPDNTDL